MSETIVMTTQTVASKELKRERFSNWAGFCFFLALTMVSFLRSSAAGILLLFPVIHEAISAFSFLLRLRAKAKIRTFPARMAAYGTAFLVVLFTVLQRAWFPHWIVVTPHMWLRALGGTLWLTGTLLSIAALWQLRYSFSIEPQARRLQKTGIYRLARHPAYLGYSLEYFGALIIAPTIPFAAVVLVWAILCRVRMHYEERVLRSAFPEYAAYAQEVGMLWPRLRTARKMRTTGKAATAHSMPMPNGVVEVTGR